MDLIEILLKEIKEGDELTDERKLELCRRLSLLDDIQADTVYKIISTYKASYDARRTVGEFQSLAPYDGEQLPNGVQFRCAALPERLLLALEKFVQNC